MVPEVVSTHRSNPANRNKTSVTTTSNCVVCQTKHPLRICHAFRKNLPTKHTKVLAAHKLCFFCLQEQQSIRQCQRSRKTGNDGCTISHDNLLDGAESIFQPKSETKGANIENKTSVKSTNNSRYKEADNPGVYSVKRKWFTANRRCRCVFCRLFFGIVLVLFESTSSHFGFLKSWQ